MVQTQPCEYTIVEWRRRAAVRTRIALSQTEYVDPATRIEDGHLIDPEILIRGRIEDRPGTPAAGADRLARGREDRGQAAPAR